MNLNIESVCTASSRKGGKKKKVLCRETFAALFEMEINTSHRQLSH